MEMADGTNIAQTLSFVPLAGTIGAAAGYVSLSRIDWRRDLRDVRRPYSILTFFHVLPQAYTDLSR